MAKEAEEMGARVKDLRKARGWRQEDLAGEAGITLQTVSNLETGRQTPRTSTLVKIAGAFGVPLVELFSDGSGSARNAATG